MCEGHKLKTHRKRAGSWRPHDGLTPYGVHLENRAGCSKAKLQQMGKEKWEDSWPKESSAIILVLAFRWAGMVSPESGKPEEAPNNIPSLQRFCWGEQLFASFLIPSSWSFQLNTPWHVFKTKAAVPESHQSPWGAYMYLFMLGKLLFLWLPLLTTLLHLRKTLLSDCVTLANNLPNFA